MRFGNMREVGSMVPPGNCRIGWDICIPEREEGTITLPGRAEVRVVLRVVEGEY
jgi:hypothetical protein